MSDAKSQLLQNKPGEPDATSDRQGQAVSALTEVVVREDVASWNDDDLEEEDEWLGTGTPAGERVYLALKKSSDKTAVMAMLGRLGAEDRLAGCEHAARAGDLDLLALLLAFCRDRAYLSLAVFEAAHARQGACVELLFPHLPAAEHPRLLAALFEAYRADAADAYPGHTLEALLTGGMDMDAALLVAAEHGLQTMVQECVFAGGHITPAIIAAAERSGHRDLAAVLSRSGQVMKDGKGRGFTPA